MSSEFSEADAYFATRLGASAYWTATTEKEAALTTAQNMLASVYSLASLTDEELLAAVCEQALFLLMNPGWDKRMALQAQGVTQASIVGETYKGPGGTPIAPRAQDLLRGRDLSAGAYGHLMTREDPTGYEL